MAETIYKTKTQAESAPKIVFDVTLGVLLLVPFCCVAVALFLLNPVFNPGPVFFCQRRMGRACQPFVAYKFRTMRAAAPGARGAFDGLETDRIGPLGRFLRRTRLDELPQILTILRGEMSMIGPRPDSFEHACVYLREIPGYAARHQVTPGISGYAQTEVGYVDGLDGIYRKVAADHHYIKHASFALDLWITWRTIAVVLTRQGS
ncbi:sugar transferase [Loktanella sp. Alg231-35]|uniref:sugar transferase n=1 Tax=Loktanella sp. Alg231-35 TaxID=1922220 RepID=UPI001F45C7C5|nr:sugar transferase [Loktanella sp. Alg231-35]